VRAWGRQGRPPTTHATFFADRCHAEAAIRRIVRRRVQHGYTVIDWH